jgi:DNA-binding NarL/FixJ family response regulator
LKSKQEKAISDQSIVRILVVDDFAPWRRFVSTIAQITPGWHVISEASDGLEAVQKAEELAPDLILLDIGLPKLNGIEAARQIRNVAPNSKILFVSTYASWEIAEGALGTGASGYVVKADAGKELAKAVEAIFQGKRYISGRLKGCTSADAEDTQAPDQLDRSEGLALPSTLAPPRKTEIIRCHEAQFYSGDACFLDSFTHFIGAALKAGNAAIVVATESHRDSLLPRLQAHGLDVAALIGQGRYISLNAADTLSTFVVNDLPDPGRFFKFVGALILAAANAAKGEHPRVAACGECAPLLWAQGKAEAAIRVEQLWNEIAKTYDIDILCGYPSRGFHRDEDNHIFRRICAEHSAIYSA